MRPATGSSTRHILEAVTTTRRGTVLDRRSRSVRQERHSSRVRRCRPTSPRVMHFSRRTAAGGAMRSSPISIRPGISFTRHIWVAPAPTLGRTWPWIPPERSPSPEQPAPPISGRGARFSRRMPAPKMCSSRASLQVRHLRTRPRQRRSCRRWARCGRTAGSRRASPSRSARWTTTRGAASRSSTTA